MKKEIKEVVGVPDGMLKSAEGLFYNLVTALNDTNYSDFVFRGSYQDELTFPTRFKINEMYITSVDVVVNYKVGDYDKIKLSEAGFDGKYSANYRRYLVIYMNNPNEIKISMDFIIPNDDVIFEDLVDYMNQNKSIITSTLAHELKHAYDGFKRPNRKMITQSEYEANITAEGYGIKGLNTFYLLLYYATTIEQLVKPTEVASRMSVGKINQKEFLNFLLNDRTYKDFNELRNYSLETLISDLLSQESELREFKKFKDISQKELIQRLLMVGYNDLSNERIQTIERYVLKDTDYLLKSIGVETANMEYFMKQVNNYKKYTDNPIEFFKKEIKYINLEGEKMIKKLGKLYSIANDDDSKDSTIIKKIYNKVNN